MRLCVCTCASFLNLSFFFFFFFFGGSDSASSAWPLPRCGHCQRLAPAYAEAARSLAEQTEKVVLAKMDATEFGRIALDNDVTGGCRALCRASLNQPSVLLPLRAAGFSSLTRIPLHAFVLHSHSVPNPQGVPRWQVLRLRGWTCC